MKSASLVKRWLFFQIIFALLFLVGTYITLRTVVRYTEVSAIKASVEQLRKTTDSMSEEQLVEYFNQTEPALVGLYKDSGEAVYVPEKGLPVNIKDYETNESILEGRFLIFIEDLPNNYSLLGFTSKERIDVIQASFDHTAIFILVIVFGLSTLGGHYVLKKLYRPLEILSSEIEMAHENLVPIKKQEAFLTDPKLKKLLFVYNKLIEVVNNQLVKLLNKQDQLKLILESVEEGIFMINNRSKVSFINKKAESFLQSFEHKNLETLLSKTELGKTIHRLLDPLVSGVVKEKFSEYGRYYDISINHLDDGQTLVILYDETDRVEKIESGKNFISNASHELRTPITVIKGFAEALLDEDALKHVNFKDVMQKILSSTERMDLLIKRLLLLADVDQRDIEIKTFDMADAIKHELHLFENIHKDAQFFYEGPSHLLFNADEELLKIVFSNFITNAIKYSKDHKFCEVTLKDEKETIQIDFKDRGIGIPESDLGKIFERFYRVDKARTRKMGGAGLGLSLVKTIVEKHGGKIAVSSIFGEGSTFSITLPKTLKPLD